MTQPYMAAGNHVITYDHGGGDGDKQNICRGQSGTRGLESEQNIVEPKNVLDAGRGLEQINKVSLETSV